MTTVHSLSLTVIGRNNPGLWPSRLRRQFAAGTAQSSTRLHFVLVGLLALWLNLLVLSSLGAEPRLGDSAAGSSISRTAGHQSDSVTQTAHVRPGDLQKGAPKKMRQMPGLIENVATAIFLGLLMGCLSFVEWLRQRARRIGAFVRLHLAHTTRVRLPEDYKRWFRSAALVYESPELFRDEASYIENWLLEDREKKRTEEIVIVHTKGLDSAFVYATLQRELQQCVVWYYGQQRPDKHYVRQQPFDVYSILWQKLVNTVEKYEHHCTYILETAQEIDLSNSDHSDIELSRLRRQHEFVAFVEKSKNGVRHSILCPDDEGYQASEEQSIDVVACGYDTTRESVANGFAVAWFWSFVFGNEDCTRFSRVRERLDYYTEYRRRIA